MKKTLLVTAVLFSIFFLAQNSKFVGNYSTKSLTEIQKTVPQNEKHEFYKQYFKAKVFEEMKDTFNYKSYSDLVLRKFTDSIFAFYDGETVINNDNVIYAPSITLEKHLESHKKYMAKDPEEMDKFLDSLGITNFKDKKMKELYESQKLQMKSLLPKVEKSPEELKKEYEEMIALEKEQFENDPSTSIGFRKMIEKLDQYFGHQDNDDFGFLLQKNLSPSFGYNLYFPYPSNEAREGSAFESVPGEILTYATETGTAGGRSFNSFIIKGNNIDPISPYPTDTKFDKKLSKYVESGWRFEPRSGYGIEKNELGEYIISTSIYTNEDYNTAPSMSIEYKTKDFKSFTPLRIAKNDSENLVWKEIR
ncbi:hypothetical protein [Chryseobacterium balustinum]|nr:hypothetical protein [Chryseobacterium balustinum]AZB32098.1 hypothetical protein EB354_22730 [Chryseobacterium balustinum]